MALKLFNDSGVAKLQAKDGEESITATADGAVKLYHDNAEKLATTSTGVDVTGTVTTDGLAVNTGAVGGTAGNEKDFALFECGSSDVRLRDIRHTDGATWSTTETRLHYSVDDNPNKQMWLSFYNPNSDTANNVIRFGEGDSNEWVRIENGIVNVLGGTIELNGNEINGVQVTIADNAFATITPTGRYGGYLSISAQTQGVFPQHPYSAFLFSDFGDSPFSSAINTGVNFNISTAGPPTGTTGTDGKVTLFIGGTSGTYYLENRVGSTHTFQITLI